ncbi:MAG: nuclear transport factor 2 family protein [Actinomycetota bacterium]|nr:nuclear transport factor 2 family protein [Actinomycetota bacterium]
MMTLLGFRGLLDTVAEGWNAGDAAMAAACFTEDAVYVEPPDRQRYDGRPHLAEFFGGCDDMSMRWHLTAFSEEDQAGFGEYTFSLIGRVTKHGIVVVEIERQLIASWREYQYDSELSFEEFAGDSVRRSR